MPSVASQLDLEIPGLNQLNYLLILVKVNPISTLYMTFDNDATYQYVTTSEYPGMGSYAYLYYESEVVLLSNTPYTPLDSITCCIQMQLTDSTVLGEAKLAFQGADTAFSDAALFSTSFFYARTRPQDLISLHTWHPYFDTTGQIEVYGC